MGIDFARTFGKPSNQGGKRRDDDEFVKADYWVNIGYQSTELNEHGEEETIFISLAKGVALDTIQPFPTNTRSLRQNRINAARNDLHDQLMSVAKGLEPGEEHIIGEDGSLQHQIRRVNAELPNKEQAENPLVRTLALS